MSNDGGRNGETNAKQEVRALPLIPHYGFATEDQRSGTNPCSAAPGQEGGEAPDFFIRQRGEGVFRVRHADPGRRRQDADPRVHARELELEGELFGGAGRPRGRLLFDGVEAVRLWEMNEGRRAMGRAVWFGHTAAGGDGRHNHRTRG